MESNEQKDVAFYSALINAWITTKMERDKLILTLASGGIALLVTLLSTIGIRNCLEAILYVLAFISFATTVFVIIIILDENSRYIEEIISTGKKTDLKLSRLDRITMISFVFGIIVSILIGGIAANNKLNDHLGDKKMSEEKTENVKPTKAEPLFESLNELGKLNNNKTMEKSLNNLGNLAPTGSGDSLNNLGKLSTNQGNTTSSTTTQSSGSKETSSSKKEE